MKVAGPGALEGSSTMTDAPRDFRPLVIRYALFLMAVGLTIYASFRIVQSDWLMWAGMAWIGIGCFATLVMLVAVRKSPGPRWKVSLLLLANFAVALLCIVSAVDVVMRIEVYVTNESGETMTDVLLEFVPGSKQRIPLPDLEPGERLARAIRGNHHGELNMRFTTGSVRHDVCLQSYVLGFGEYIDAVIGPGGAAVVDNTRPTFLWPIIP